MNVQYAIKDGEVYVLEVNPRASRTVPLRQQGHGRAAAENRRRADAWARNWKTLRDLTRRNCRTERSPYRSSS